MRKIMDNLQFSLGIAPLNFHCILHPWESGIHPRCSAWMQVPSTRLQGLTEPNDFGGFIYGSRAIRPWLWAFELSWIEKTTLENSFSKTAALMLGNLNTADLRICSFAPKTSSGNFSKVTINIHCLRTFPFRRRTSSNVQLRAFGHPYPLKACMLTRTKHVWNTSEAPPKLPGLKVCPSLFWHGLLRKKTLFFHMNLPGANIEYIMTKYDEILACESSFDMVGLR